jgi:hypothetical protein
LGIVHYQRAVLPANAILQPVALTFAAGIDDAAIVAFFVPLTKVPDSNRKRLDKIGWNNFDRRIAAKTTPTLIYQLNSSLSSASPRQN